MGHYHSHPADTEACRAHPVPSRQKNTRAEDLVGFLDQFERSLERAVGSAFAKTFRTGVHPVEIVAALKHEMDSRAQVVSRERILVPYDYRMVVSPADEQRLAPLGEGLVHEIIQALDLHRAQQGYSATHPLQMSWEVDASMTEGIVEARAVDHRESVVWVPMISVGGQRYLLTQRHTLLGRGSDVDIAVDGKGISRHHSEIVWDGKRAEVIDLGSTNGTLLDGESITRAALPDRCTLTLGNTRIVCEVVAQESRQYEMLRQSTPGAPVEGSQ
jgi:hypothetical protein